MSTSAHLAGTFVRLAILCCVSTAAAIGESYHTLRLSDKGYDNIRFVAPSGSAIRTTHVFRSSVTTGDPCSAFYDMTFLLDNNAIERLGGVALARLTPAMRLQQSPGWSFKSTPDAADLRMNLDYRARKMLWVGMSASLAHAGRFVPSNDPPRALVGGAEAQDCFFDVQVQYFIKFDAPAFMHIIALDTTPRCGSRLLREEGFRDKKVDTAAFKNWIDGLGIEGQYQQFLNELLRQPQSQFVDDLNTVRSTEAYKDLVKHCRDATGNTQ